MNYLLTGILFLLAYSTYSQSPTIPQLRDQLMRAKHTTARIRLYTELTRLYICSEKPSDSVNRLAQQGFPLAGQYGLGINKNLLCLYPGYSYKRQLINEFVRRKILTYEALDSCKIYALAYQQLGKSDPALAYGQEACNAAQKVGYLNQKQCVLITLINRKESQEQYPQALTHVQQLNNLNDSLFINQKSGGITKAEVLYRLTQQKQTSGLLQKEASLRKIRFDENQQELKVKQRQNLLLIVVAMLLMVGVVWLFIGLRREQAISRLLAAQKADIQNKAEQLQASNQAKDKLFAIIGHDLRSPVASLKSQLTGVQEGYISPTQLIQRMGQLVQSVDRVYLTLDNLLHWAMLQREGIKNRPTSFNLADIAQAVQLLFKTELDAKQLTMATNFQAAPVNADEHQLHIVVRNLLHNAIKFTPAGGMICLTTDHKDGKSILTVQDSGIGMDLESRRLPIGQYLSGRGTVGEKGTGLGLIICRELVQLNHGQFTLASLYGNGTTATVTL